MAKYTLKIMRCSHRNIFKVYLTIFQYFVERVKEMRPELVVIK